MRHSDTVLDPHLYTRYSRYMTAKEKRPRIPADLAERMDAERGSDSFEEYVANILRGYLGSYEILPDPTGKNRYTILGVDDKIVATGLTKVEADYRVIMLRAADRAYDALTELFSAADQIGNMDVFEAGEAASEAVFDITVSLSENLS